MIRHVVSRFLSVLALPLVLSLAVAPVASAQDGVQVDPDSPPAVEYALPLAEARGDAAPAADAGDATEAGAPPPAFGSGITPKADRAGASGSGDRGAGSQRADAPGRSGEPSAARPPAARPGDVGGSATLYSLGAAAGILLVGGLVGLALRRRQSSA